MRRLLLFVVTGAIAVFAAAGAVHAITFGESDNGRHPFVGALVADFEGDTFQICSGTLLSPTVFLTAAHCLAGNEEFGLTNVRVTFDEIIDADLDGVVDPGVTTYGGTSHPHPLFGVPGGGSDGHDVGVFLLTAPGVTTGPYGQLATANLLDTVDKRTTRFTTVGYGLARNDKKKGPHSLEGSPGRLVATQELLSLQRYWAEFSMNISTGSGGTCYGDSGGPHFLGAEATETRIVVAVTVTGDRWCRATDKTYRVDTDSAREFLDDFVTLP
jgi:hypothetical protein